MISIFSAAHRLHEGPPDSGRWATFDEGGGLGPLQQLDELVLPPGGAPQTWNAKGELLTYAQDGHVTCNGAVPLKAPGVQLVNGALAPWQLHNHSETASARLFQLTFAPSRRRKEAAHTQRRFSFAERRRQWALIASPDERDGALSLLSRARVFSTLLHDGFHVVHELGAGRAAWLHVVDGECFIGSQSRLRSGDAAAFVNERSVSITSRGSTELLLVEVLVAPSFRWSGGH